MYIHRTTVEIIKLTLANASYHSISKKDFLLGSIRLLQERYTDTGNRNLLYKAIQHVYAYIELGFAFERHIDEFKEITECLKLSMEDVFPEELWKYKKIKLAKTEIYDLLGRWNPRLHSMKVAQVINDIYDNVLHMREGEYLYHSGKLLAQDKDDALWEQTFKLYIQEGEAIFYDVNHNKYYAFEKRVRDE